MARSSGRGKSPARRAFDRADYEVGYRKPPVNTRFKPGQSGNPRGRPRGAKNKAPRPIGERLKAIILAEAYREVRVNDGDRQVKLSMIEAIIRSMAVAAARGQPRAQRIFTHLVSMTERDIQEHNDTYVQVMIEYKTFWERELERRKALGIRAPDPVPHPDHILIDMVNNRVILTGPMTNDDRLIAHAMDGGKELADNIARMEEFLKDHPDGELRDEILQHMRQEQRKAALIAKIIKA